MEEKRNKTIGFIHATVKEYVNRVLTYFLVFSFSSLFVLFQFTPFS